jgi:hypothetical protein
MTQYADAYLSQVRAEAERIARPWGKSGRPVARNACEWAMALASQALHAARHDRDGAPGLAQRFLIQLGALAMNWHGQLQGRVGPAAPPHGAIEP